MKTIVWPSSFAMSVRTAFRRSSNSPRYFAPASSSAMSSTSSRLPFSDSGTSPLTMRCASPSTMAVLPTPGSPISTGLFFVRRCRIWIVRRISSSRPITGSSLPCRARSVRSIVYFFSASRCDSASALLTFAPPRTASIAAMSAVFVSPASRARRPASPLSSAIASRNISLATNSSPRFCASRSAMFSRPARSRPIWIWPPVPCTCGSRVDRLLERRREPLHVDAGALQQRACGAVLLVQQREQDVDRLDELVVVAARDALRIGERLLELGREFVDSHGGDPKKVSVQVGLRRTLSSASTQRPRHAGGASARRSHVRRNWSKRPVAGS